MSQALHPETPLASASEPPLQERIVTVGRDLASTLDRVLTALPGRPQRPQHVARELGMTADFACRLLKAVQSKDSMAVAHLIPGPDPLRRALKGARKKNVSEGLIAEAEEAIRRFEELIETTSGDRGALDAMISAWVPEVRQKVEVLSRQTVYKGMSLLDGVIGETSWVTKVVHPSADGVHLDKVVVGSMIGYRRIRANAPLAMVFNKEPGRVSGDLSLDGVPVEAPHHIVLPEFSSSPPPRFEAKQVGTRLWYSLSDESVGLKAAVTITYALRKPAFDTLERRADGAEFLSFWASDSTPVRRLVFDVLLHERVCPGSEPRLAVYRPSVQGLASFGDPNREPDLLQVDDVVATLGRGLARFRHADLPFHTDLLRHVCGKTGWDPESFRGFRCEIEYPLSASQVFIAFKR